MQVHCLIPVQGCLIAPEIRTRGIQNSEVLVQNVIRMTQCTYVPQWNTVCNAIEIEILACGEDEMLTR